jgi:hypothetical protein
MFIITTIDGPFVCSVERNVCLEDGCVATFGWVAGSLPSPGVVVRMVCWRCGYVTTDYNLLLRLLSCLLPGVFQIPTLGRWIYVKAGLQRPTASNMQSIEVNCTVRVAALSVECAFLWHCTCGSLDDVYMSPLGYVYSGQVSGLKGAL